MWKNKIVANTLESPDQLLAHYANPRTHDGKQRDTMRASLDELGIIAPCTVNDRTGNMIDGHMRTEEYLTAGVKEVPVIHLDLSEEDELKAIAYFDAVGTLAGYNPEKLEDLLQQIDFVNEPLENMLTDLLDDKPKVLPDGIDDIPDVETPVSKLGDLWLLNGHRVLCGDSTDKQTVELLMDGKKADMVFTDPPYGMSLDTDFSSMKSNLFKGKTGGAYHGKVIGDHDDFTPELITTIFDHFSYCKEIIIWGADYIAELIPNRNDGSWFVWDKRLDDSADKMYGSSFELAWSKTRHKRDIIRHKWAGIFGMEKEDTKTRQHPTQKPTGLCNYFIETLSKTGNKIIDLYLGSGSTLIACEQTDRTCYGLELDPHYVDVICKRWQTLTGQMPILESTGEAHDFATSDS